MNRTRPPEPKVLAVFTTSELCHALRTCHPGRWPVNETVWVSFDPVEGILTVRDAHR